MAGARRWLLGGSVFVLSRRHGLDDVIMKEEAPGFLTVAEKVLRRTLGHISSSSTSSGALP